MLIQEKSAVKGTRPPFTSDGSTPLLKILPSILPIYLWSPSSLERHARSLSPPHTPLPISLTGEASFQTLSNLFPLGLCSQCTRFLSPLTLLFPRSSPPCLPRLLSLPLLGSLSLGVCTVGWKVHLWVWLPHQAIP